MSIDRVQHSITYLWRFGWRHGPRGWLGFRETVPCLGGGGGGGQYNIPLEVWTVTCSPLSWWCPWLTTQLLLGTGTRGRLFPAWGVGMGGGGQYSYCITYLWRFRQWRVLPCLGGALGWRHGPRWGLGFGGHCPLPGGWGWGGCQYSITYLWRFRQWRVLPCLGGALGWRHGPRGGLWLGGDCPLPGGPWGLGFTSIQANLKHRGRQIASTLLLFIYYWNRN